MQTEQESPLFLATPRNTKALLGSEVTLDCAANGNPMPEILWLKDGESIDLNHLDSRLVAPLFLLWMRQNRISIIEQFQAYIQAPSPLCVPFLL